MSVFELPTVTLIPNGIHHPPIEDGRLLPNSVKSFHLRNNVIGISRSLRKINTDMNRCFKI
ncbi:hypothetical protein CWC54_02905 [Enterococcus faecium]|nr:hypothetical protein CWC54_02905 [Enterococcus faecium]